MNMMNSNTARVVFFSLLFLMNTFSGIYAQKGKTGSLIFLGDSLVSDDFYPILPWDFLGEPEYALKDVVDCNFTVGGFIRPYDVGRVESHGLKAIIDMELDIRGHSLHRRIWRNLTDEEIESKVRILIENSGNSDAILGYFIMDEPSVLDFPYLRKAVDAVRKYAPDKLAYINLFPDYATLWSMDNLNSQLGTKTYTEYLERYVNEVNPQFISYDNYMIQYSKDLQEEKRGLSYFTNLLEIRRVALKYKLPYWNIVSSIQLNDSSIPSFSNMLFHAYTSLAAGYNGISWFQYNGGDYNPVNESYEKTPVWHSLKEVNRQIQALGPIINQLTSTGIYFTSSFLGLDSMYVSLPGKHIESIKCAEPLMVGEFLDSDGNRYAMVVNLSMERSAKFTLSTKSGEEGIYTYVPSGNDPGLPVIKKADLNNHKKGYWLVAGEGILMKFED